MVSAPTRARQFLRTGKGDGGRGGNREQLININDISMTRENARGDASEPLVKVICVAETYLYTGKANQAAQQK